MTFRVIRKVLEHKILYKFRLRQYFIQLTVLEIERDEWEALILVWAVKYNNTLKDL